jgi:hypothetical protein
VAFGGLSRDSIHEDGEFRYESTAVG